MALEIERKFLVVGTSWRDDVERSLPMAQGYLGGERSSVRVRIEGEQALLNIKSRSAGTSRLEFEYPIVLDDAQQMLEQLAGDLVTKTRHHVRHQGMLWEIDEFAADNAGLIVAEIELEHAEQAFAAPSWLGREVSHEARYYNARLAQHPFCHWPDRDLILKELAC